MLINLSNHPSSNWSSQQLSVAEIYGDLADLPFPAVDPSGDEKYIQSLCEEYLQKINNICRDLACNKSTITVHIMGEMTFTFAILKALQKQNIECISSTTERISSEEDGLKTSEFKFVKFRKYQ